MASNIVNLLVVGKWIFYIRLLFIFLMKIYNVYADRDNPNLAFTTKK